MLAERRDAAHVERFERVVHGRLPEALVIELDQQVCEALQV
jgi:hypothetical protein